MMSRDRDMCLILVAKVSGTEASLEVSSTAHASSRRRAVVPPFQVRDGLPHFRRKGRLLPLCIIIRYHNPTPFSRNRAETIADQPVLDREPVVGYFGRADTDQ